MILEINTLINLVIIIENITNQCQKIFLKIFNIDKNNAF